MVTTMIRPLPMSQKAQVQTPALLRFDYLLDLFSTKVDSAFDPYKVDEMSTTFFWGLACDRLVYRPGEANGSFSYHYRIHR